MKTTLKSKSNITLVIDDICIEYYPCKHYVTLNGEYKCLDGIEICKWCIKNNIEIPEHFQYYKNVLD